MGMDLDYIAAKQAIEELEELLNCQQHGKREKFADEIINFVEKMKAKYNDSFIDKINSWDDGGCSTGLNED